MFASSQLVLAALFLLPPPIFTEDDLLPEAWKAAAGAVAACSAKAAAGKRAGTVWVDFTFPEYPVNRLPTWTLRTSPGLGAADRACVRDVVVRKVLRELPYAAHQWQGQTLT